MKRQILILAVVSAVVLAGGYVYAGEYLKISVLLISQNTLDMVKRFYVSGKRAFGL